MQQQTKFSGRKILVIDDEVRLTQSLVSLLRGVGYHVVAATSGEEGLDHIKKERFHLVITDLRMAEVDGFDIMSYLAKERPETGIIVITGHASTNSAIEALHQRAADYITKPFDFEVLCSSIERVFAHQNVEELRRDMVHMLTHDIKVPLTNVLGFSQLIAEDKSLNPEKVEHYAQTISLNCQKLLLMMDNYLINARLEEGRLDTSLSPLDIQDLIEECVSLIYYEFEKRQVELEIEFGEIPRSFSADGTLLGRALNNLLNNAAKYTPKGERVLVHAGLGEENHLVIRVANSGTSLTHQEVQSLFDRYQRGSSSLGIDGSGLGLHIVRCIAEAHGGRAWCSLEDGMISFHLGVPLLTGAARD